MKTRQFKGILSIVLIAAGYYLLRFPLLYLHGMKQWPLFMAIIALCIVLLFWIPGNTTVPLVTASGYVLGFVIGYLFQSYSPDQGGGSSNDLWWIWLCSFLCFVMLGVICSSVDAWRKHKMKKRETAPDAEKKDP